MNKKGLSPVIATVLLVSLVLVLASIIFLWARAFIPEKVQKFDSPVEDSCKNVVFEAAYGAGTVTVQNNGNVPIYGIQVGVRTGGSLDYVEVSQASTIVAGGSGHFTLYGSSAEGKELLIVPVLLGKTSNGELRAFACGSDSAKTIQA
ncbi:MAG TPA: archaellin/type IV pilin N-terminal domain-containing protein [Candidatus Nanoarchaeia archaeon]|nr:archaellin/type IV pilin N-terminal domain-containing protein [Candidatus Nanoarchaeia archaeon]